MEPSDEDLFNQNSIIVRSIANCRTVGSGLTAQYIMDALRTFEEILAFKLFCDDTNFTGARNQENNKTANKYISSSAKYSFLSVFHQRLQKIKSHFALSDDEAERALYCYFDSLIEIREFWYQRYHVNLLENLEDFEFSKADSSISYYKAIYQTLDLALSESDAGKKNIFYIQKTKTVYLDHHVFYELTLSFPSDEQNKFDRITVYSREKVLPNYAISAGIVSKPISLFGQTVQIKVLKNWAVSIRPCEFNSFGSFFGDALDVRRDSTEYFAIMEYLKANSLTLLDVYSSSKEQFLSFDRFVSERTAGAKIRTVMAKCRPFLLEKKAGCNFLSYVLYTMRYSMIQDQHGDKRVPEMSNLFCNRSSIPFDQLPFVMSPAKHLTRFEDLIECIGMDGHEDEILYHYLFVKANRGARLYTPVEELTSLGDYRKLAEKFNSRLYKTHHYNDICFFQEYAYIKGYEADVVSTLKRLAKLSTENLPGYSNYIDQTMKETGLVVEDPAKENALRTMFESSGVGVIYGSAGTGKTLLINLISNMFPKAAKIFLAQTHPAVENLRRRIVHKEGCRFSTIAKALAQDDLTQYGILFIDECSTVSNQDIDSILAKKSFRIVVLSGDIYQIPSISFGNWFSLLPYFLPKTAIYELSNTYRTTNAQLLGLWDSIRKCDKYANEKLLQGHFCSSLDNSIFTAASEDEVILCLNYDGMYGINNINRYLQSANPNPGVDWGERTFKKGDPILFNENPKYSRVFYNNLKGKIDGVSIVDGRLCCDIETEIFLDPLNPIVMSEAMFIRNTPKGSVFRFFIDETKDSDIWYGRKKEDPFPFQLAYAVSIHKAQGLEYDSVKVIITDEVAEKVTHSIFYTAITRAKRLLRIYMPRDYEKNFLPSLHPVDGEKDGSIIKNRYF